MVKYYRYGYDSRLGGDFIELFDNSIKKIKTIKNPEARSWKPSVDMQEIVNRFDVVSAVKNTLPLSGNWLKVIGNLHLTEEQMEKTGRRVR